MYNMPNPYYQYKKNKKDTLLTRLTKQLAAVLVILLVFLLLKYIKNDKIVMINGKIRTVFYSDYTKQTVDVFKSKSPDLNAIIKKIFVKEQKKEEVKFEFLPVEGKITSPYGDRQNPISKEQESHKGIDINAKLGTPVKAVMNGVVDSAKESKTYGKEILIEHENGYKTLYAHLSEIKVSEGQVIKKGDVIGLTGNTGMSRGPHLHFEVQKSGKYMDPMTCFKAIEN